MKCTQYGLYGQATSIIQGSGQGRDRPMSVFFGVALARRHDKCNARSVFLRRPPSDSHIFTSPYQSFVLHISHNIAPKMTVT